VRAAISSVTDEHDQRTKQDCEGRSGEQRLAAAPQPVRVARGEGKAGADDRVHQRREQHGADHHCRRRQQQAQNGNARAHRGHEDVAAGQQRFAAHPFDRRDMVEIGDDAVAPPHANFGQSAQHRPAADRAAAGEGPGAGLIVVGNAGCVVGRAGHRRGV
jgi:hypothetical protein